jgi:hypothetical protein
MKTLALMAVLVGWRYHVLPEAPKPSEIWIKVTRQDVCVLFGSPYYQRIKCE